MPSNYKHYLFILVLIFIGVYIKNKLLNIPTVQLDEDEWWGPGNKQEHVDEIIREFKINVSEEVLLDLKNRLSNARPLNLPLQTVQHQYGINTGLIQNILNYWIIKYNWKNKREKYFNKFRQFTTNIQGLQIHYVHEKPNEKLVAKDGLRVVPLLLLHGWPGSVREFYDLVPHLTKPQEKMNFAFEVVVPSLPGYGFSQAASKPGLGAIQIAVLLNNLMKRLNIDMYYIQGGDWGSVIGSVMASLYPDRVLGFHSNMCFTMEPLPNLKMILGSLYPALIVEEKFEDRMYPLSSMYSRLLAETGYLHLQATKPDTIGVALTDSPIGLAAYILEKFISFTDTKLTGIEGGKLRDIYGYEALLDNVMIYWLTGSITSSMRLYAETFNPNQFALGWLNQPVRVPSACSRFKYEVAFQPECVLRDKYENLVYLKDHDFGGHFPAMEVPKVLIDDIWSAISVMEKLK